jgi:hypothetical protein
MMVSNPALSAVVPESPGVNDVLVEPENCQGEAEVSPAVPDRQEKPLKTAMADFRGIEKVPPERRETPRERGAISADHNPSNSRKSRFPMFLLFGGLTAFFLTSGVFYFGGNNPGRPPLVKIFPIRGENGGEAPAYEIRDLKWFLNRQPTGLNFYVVRGTVTNVGKANSEGILIQAILLGKDNQALTMAEAFAGNLIDETLLPHMSRVRIEGFLGMRYGEKNINRDIPTGSSLPFMVVCFEPQNDVESLLVKAMDAEEKEKPPVPGDRVSNHRFSSQKTIKLKQ